MHPSLTLPALQNESKINLYTASGPLADTCLLDASNDLDATLKWLELYKAKSTTYRAYQREAMRFLLWCSYEAGKNLTSLKVKDLEAHLQFLQNPPPKWCTNRSALRSGKDSSNWRPFVGSLNISAYQCSVRVLNFLLNYLVQADYIRSPPKASSK